ncbi:DMT family transporter [Peptococcus simiae]|uniref:DMT family transporter n=1 Tax=Peptococcus simiae TaxID=1643805 RepID=A0ABW9GZF8_9FIRM
MKKGIFYMLLAALLFSSMEIALKMTGTSYQPLQLNALRFLIGGLILLPLAHRQNRDLPRCLPLWEYAFYGLTGFVCIVLSMTVYLLSIRYTDASTVAVIFSCNAFFAVLFSAAFLRQPVSRATSLGLAIAFTGLFILMDPLHMGGDALGIFLAIGSAILFAIYAVLVKLGQGKSAYHGLIPTAYTFLLGTAELLVLMGLTHLAPVGDFLTGLGLEAFVKVPFFAGISLAGLPLLLYISIFVTGLGFAAYGLAIEHGSVTVASIAFLIKPVLAPVLCYFILGEEEGLLAILGIIIVAVGSLVITLESFRAGRSATRRTSLAREKALD